MLADMQARLARSAYDALNIQAGDVGPAEVRTAFLELTKTFHPAKFARMSAEIQKLANEVFLGLRAAHDQLARPKTATRPSGSFVPGKTPATPQTPPTGMRQPTPPNAPRANVPPAPTQALNPPTQRGVPPAPSSALNPPTVRGVPPAPVAVATQRLPAVQPKPVAPPSTQPRPGVPAAPNHRAPGTPPTAQPVRRVTPAGGVPATTSGPRPAVAQPTPAGGLPNAKPAAAPAEPELVDVYNLLEKGQWEQARTTLNALIALMPKPRYRALIQYSLGREAQVAHRREDARAELLGALEIDPDLQLAKTALAELFRRK